MRLKLANIGLTRRILLAVGLPVCFLVGLTGCRDQVAIDPAGAAAAKPIVKQATRGPVSLTVTAARDTISIAERLELHVEAQAPADFEIELPDVGPQITDFQLRDVRIAPAETTADGGQRVSATYELDTFLSGAYRLPAITLQYWDLRGVADGDRAATLAAPSAELVTEPMTITVNSLLEGEFDPTDFRDVRGVATLRADPTWLAVRWIAGGLAAAGILVVVVAWIVRRARRPRRAVVVPPHVWAFEQLQQLADAGLIESGKVKAFYYRLSEIVRVYIELRFGLMAPERTTEEFLVEMQRSPVLATDHQVALTTFLHACDLVKYATYQPAVAEIEQAFNSARDFVEQTRQVSAAREQAA